MCLHIRIFCIVVQVTDIGLLGICLGACPMGGGGEGALKVIDISADIGKAYWQKVHIRSLRLGLGYGVVCPKARVIKAGIAHQFAGYAGECLKG